MNEVPDFWRTEVWHPLSVHFPIAFLVFSTVFYCVSLFSSEKGKWFFITKILLTIGVISAWIGIYTGNMADGIVSRKICDPTVLKDHEITAYTASILFSVALLFLIIENFQVLKKGAGLLKILILGLLLTGSGFLAYAGHLGATVVYQQGAGVFHPSEDCREFE